MNKFYDNHEWSVFPKSYNTLVSACHIHNNLHGNIVPLNYKENLNPWKQLFILNGHEYSQCQIWVERYYSTKDLSTSHNVKIRVNEYK
jgi:hypothetical protein